MIRSISTALCVCVALALMAAVELKGQVAYCASSPNSAKSLGWQPETNNICIPSGHSVPDGHCMVQPCGGNCGNTCPSTTILQCPSNTSYIGGQCVNSDSPPSSGGQCDNSCSTWCTCCDVCATGSGCYDASVCTELSGGTPIALDLGREGFRFTSQEEGVKFDFYGTGRPIQIAWTDAKYKNAWLALDRNGNGKIDSAKELFSDIAEQPASGKPNGFLALAEFDLPANGGNGDGFIDEKDAVYSKLRLWIDSNHNGISEPGELFTLAQKGVKRLALKYQTVGIKDQYGNLLRYRSVLVPAEDGPEDERVFDVILKGVKEQK